LWSFGKNSGFGILTKKNLATLALATKIYFLKKTSPDDLGVRGLIGARESARSSLRLPSLHAIGARSRLRFGVTDILARLRN
jgi:hypothetical protein